jgi:hypothetical protein
MNPEGEPGGGKEHPNHYPDKRYIEWVRRYEKWMATPNLGVPKQWIADELDIPVATAKNRLRQLELEGELRSATSVENLHAKGYRSDDEPESVPPKGPKVGTD